MGKRLLSFPGWKCLSIFTLTILLSNASFADTAFI